MDISNLPVELQNNIFYYYAEHPCARMIKQRVNYMYFKKIKNIKDMDHLLNNNFDMNIVKHLYYIQKRNDYLEDNFFSNPRSIKEINQEFDRLFHDEVIHKFNNNEYAKNKKFDRWKEEYENYLDEKFIKHHFHIDNIKYKLYDF